MTPLLTAAPKSLVFRPSNNPLWETFASSQLDRLGSNLIRRDKPIPGFPLEFDLDGKLTHKGINDLSEYLLIATKDPAFCKGFVELVRSPEFERKAEVHQMTAYHTKIANHQVSSRYEHSLHSVFMLAEFAERIGLPTEVTKLMLTVMLLHDIGHAPFSHTAEQALGEIGIRDFDHDIYARDIITSPRIQNIITQMQSGILGDYRFTAEEVADIIAPDDAAGNLQVFKTIKDIFDRSAYLIQDFTRSHLSTEEKNRAVTKVYDFLLSLKTDFDSPDFRIWSDSIVATKNMLDLRQDLFRKVSQHPETALANHIIGAELRRLFKRGMDINSFYTSAQVDIEQAFTMGSRNRLLRIRDYNLPVIALPFSCFRPEVSGKLSDYSMQEQIRKFMEGILLGRLSSRAPHEAPFSVFTNADYSKRWEFTAIEKHGEEQHVFIRETPAEDRYLLIVANLPYFQEKRIGITASTLQHWREEFLKTIKPFTKAATRGELDWKSESRKIIDLSNNILDIHYEVSLTPTGWVSTTSSTIKP